MKNHAKIVLKLFLISSSMLITSKILSMNTPPPPPPLLRNGGRGLRMLSEEDRALISRILRNLSRKLSQKRGLLERIQTLKTKSKKEEEIKNRNIKYLKDIIHNIRMQINRISNMLETIHNEHIHNTEQIRAYYETQRESINRYKCSQQKKLLKKFSTTTHKRGD